MKKGDSSMGKIKKIFENSNSTWKKIIICIIIVSVLIRIILLIYCRLYKNQKMKKKHYLMRVH